MSRPVRLAGSPRVDMAPIIWVLSSSYLVYSCVILYLLKMPTLGLSKLRAYRIILSTEQNIFD